MTVRYLSAGWRRGWWCLFLVLFAAGPAEAAYVLYSSEHGDWRVLCWRDHDTAPTHCSLTAPQQRLAGAANQSILLIDEYAPQSYQAAIVLRERTMPDLPVYIRIDAHPVHQTLPQDGFARWYGETALAILTQMLSGQILVFRLQTYPEGLPQDVRVSLAGFEAALLAYRQALRTFGLLPASN